MNKTLKPDEVKALLASTAMPLTPAPLSRREKLERWAKAVAMCPFEITMLHGVEYQPKHALNGQRVVGSIFEVAASDPVIRDAGYAVGDIGKGIDFFELSPHEVHHMACDCLGKVPNRVISSRILQCASGGPIPDEPQVYIDQAPRSSVASYVTMFRGPSIT